MAERRAAEQLIGMNSFSLPCRTFTYLSDRLIGAAPPKGLVRNSYLRSKVLRKVLGIARSSTSQFWKVKTIGMSWRFWGKPVLPYFVHTILFPLVPHSSAHPGSITLSRPTARPRGGQDVLVRQPHKRHNKLERAGNSF